MANAMTVDRAYTRDREKMIRYNVVLSGNYVQAVRGANTGEVLIPNSATGNYRPDQYWGPVGPERGYVLNGPAGYSVEILPGADRSHWLLKIYSAVGTELNAGAYPAALSGDLDFYVEFVGGLSV